jgi:aminoglycoside/choline kinase family phosphotransferase
MTLQTRSIDAASETHDRVEAYLKKIGADSEGTRVVPLTGDASDRSYFRVIPAEGASVVFAVHAAAIDYERLPFVNVAELLRQMPVPIPALLAHDDALGIIVQEDLGDVTLQAHLGAAPPADHAALYRQAVGLIAVLQRRGAELESSRYMPYGVAFDVEKLTWELDFFIKHFMEAYRGVTLDPDDRAAIRAACRPIVDELASEPRVLCHRDYHSRNLMLHDAQLYIIDFQDARMGPDTYDLSSLLCDAYVDLSEQAVDDLIAYFLALRGETESEREFRLRFDLMALQRNLKALGTFGYQTTARRNPVYIQYIPRTLRYVANNFHRNDRFRDLHQLLAAHLEELR